MSIMFRCFLFILISFLNVIQLQAQERTDFGYADESIPELSQFEYYRGVWQSELEIKQEDGSFQKLEATATITGMFLEDHKTFQSKFTTDRGFFSTDIRSFNITTMKWEALFLNATAQRWHGFTSQLIDGQMTTIVEGGYSGKEDYDVKVVDTIISDKEYLKRVYNSYDGMKTWELTYRIQVRKVS